MTAGSVDRLTRQRIIENHVIGVYPEWIATGLGVDPDTVRGPQACTIGPPSTRPRR